MMSGIDKKIAECETKLLYVKTREQKQHYERLIKFYKETKRRMNR